MLDTGANRRPRAVRLVQVAVATILACGVLLGTGTVAAADDHRPSDQGRHHGHDRYHGEGDHDQGDGQPVIFYAGHPDDYQPGPPSDIISETTGLTLQSLPVPVFAPYL